MKKLLNAQGELLSIDYVKDGLEGLSLAREGVFNWQDPEVVRKILSSGDDLMKEELEEVLEGYTGEYVRVISLENFLYDWFEKNKFQGDIMRVIHRDFIDETLLHIQVKVTTKLIWTYDYKIRLDSEGEVCISEELLVDEDAYDKEFTIDKHSEKIEDLEACEKPKHGSVRV